MSILNVNQIQPVGSGQTVTITAADISASSSTITANTFTGNLTGNVTGNVTSSSTSTFSSGLNVTGGSVGIGTDNPVNKFHATQYTANTDVATFQIGSASAYTGFVNCRVGTTGAGSFIGGLYTPDGSLEGLQGTNGLIFSTSGSNLERLRITSSGNLGIGTVPQSWSGFRSLQLGGTTSIWSVEGGQAGSSFYSNNIYFDGSNRRYLTNNSASEYIQDASTGNHIFYEASSGTAGNTLSGYTEIARFTSNGLKVPSGSGIDFSATSDASGMTSELLDDYEEGTFDPIYRGGSTDGTPSYVARVGRYIKIGQLVHLTIIVSGTISGAVGQLEFGGMPFVPAQDAIGTFQANNAGSYASNVGQYSAYIGSGTNYMTFRGTKTDGTSHDNLSVRNVTYMRVSISFRVN